MSDEGKGMNWGEFKKLVEKQGVKDEDPLWYIDANYSTMEGGNLLKNPNRNVQAKKNSELGWWITGGEMR